jgi:hypothetical protein
MEDAPISPGTAGMAPGRRLIGFALAAALLLVSIPLAGAGTALVPGAAEGAPRWVTGVFGSGLGVGSGLFLGLFYWATALWVALLPCARDLGLRVVATIAAALIALFVLAPPLLSLDVFSYVAYARLGVEHGLNPYEYAPADIPFDAAASRVVDYRDAVSVYGPLFTLGTYPLGAVGVGFAVWSLKLLAGAAVAAIARLVARLAALRGVTPAAAVAFVALNPIVLVQLVGGAHNDAAMTAVAFAAVGAALTARPAAAGAGFVLAAAVKVSGLLYAPFAVVGSAGRGRLLIAAIAAAVVVTAVALLAFGTPVSEALSVAGGNQDKISRWGIPATLSRITGVDVDVVRTLALAAYAVAVVGLLVAVARGLDWVRAAAWASLGLLVASAYLAPWYLIWLLPMAAIARDRALVGATILLTVFQVINGVPT